LQFEVNSHIDVNGDFVKAYELALHFELLLASKRKSVANISVNELAAKVDILAIQQKEWRDFGASDMNNYENNGYFDNEAQYNNRNPQYDHYNDQRWHKDGDLQHNRRNHRYNDDYNQRRYDSGDWNQYLDYNHGRMYDSQDRLQYAYNKNRQRDGYFSRDNSKDDYRDDERDYYREKRKESPQDRFQDWESPEVGVAIPLGHNRSPSPVFNKREQKEQQRYSPLPEVRVSSPIRKIGHNSSGKGGGSAKKDVLNDICAVNISSKCDEKSCISAELNGVKVNCLLDTGAHVSLMSVETAKKLGIQSLTPAKFSAIIGIGDNPVSTVGQAKINLKMANCEVKTNFMVINRRINKNGSYEVILGRESLKLLPLTLNLMTGELSSINDNTVMNVNKISTESNANSLVKEIEITSLESSAERREESEKRLNQTARYERNSKDNKNLTNSVNTAKMARKNRICYFCRQPGHYMNNCPKKSHADKAGKLPTMKCYYVSQKEPTRSNKNNCLENPNWRECDYLKENNRCKNEINNWRSPPHKDEPDNRRNMSSLKLEQHGRIFKGANWRKLPERQIVQHGRMYKDANWREVPVLDSDQFGKSFKDVRCDVMDL
jgi:hypothetical protein